MTSVTCASSHSPGDAFEPRDAFGEVERYAGNGYADDRCPSISCTCAAMACQHQLLRVTRQELGAQAPPATTLRDGRSARSPMARPGSSAADAEQLPPCRMRRIGNLSAGLPAYRFGRERSSCRRSARARKAT